MWLLLPSCQVEKVLGANVTVRDDVRALIKSCHYFKRERSFIMIIIRFKWLDPDRRQKLKVCSC